MNKILRLVFRNRYQCAIAIYFETMYVKFSWKWSIHNQNYQTMSFLSATRRSSYPGSVRNCTVYGYCTRKLVLMSACFDNMLRIMYGYIYCRN